MTTLPETLIQLVDRGVTRFCLPGWDPNDYVILSPSQHCFIRLDGSPMWTTREESETPGYWLEWIPEFRYALTITVQGQTHDDLAQMLHAVAASIADRPGLAAIGGNDSGEYTYTLEDLAQ
jgi:hypothetical protein